VDPKRVYVASPEAAPAGMVVAKLRVEQVCVFTSVSVYYLSSAT
jgi:hypothetical protein